MAKKRKTERRRRSVRSGQESRVNRQLVRRAIVSIVIVVIVVATVALLVLRGQSDVSIAENAIGSLLTPVQNALNTATSAVKNFVTNWRDYDALQDEYDALYQENMQLSLELDSAEEAIQENERLTELLDAQDTYESLDPVYAKVIAREAGQWFTTFTVNRGTMHGITSGMAVVNGDGLIGRVYEVGLNYAKVITIISPDSSVGCLIQSTRENGILRGGTSDTADDAECYVYYLPNLNSITPGDVVVTSGTDSVYPKGLTIGTVTEVSLDAGSEGSYAVVKPAVDFQRIEEVLILRDVVETAVDSTDDDDLPAVPTATPSPTSTPSPTDDADTEEVEDPDTTEGTWSYPTAGTDTTATEAPDSSALEALPEDDWVDD